MVEIRKTLYFARFSSTTRCVGVFVFQCSSILFFGIVFAKVSQIPCFRVFLTFLGSILASFSKFLSGKLQKREVFAWSTCGKPSSKYPEMTTKTISRRSTKQKENTSRSRMDVITPPIPIPPNPPPRPPSPSPPNPSTELKDRCKSKPACAESREMAKTLQKTDAKCDTHKKTPKKKRCEMES